MLRNFHSKESHFQNHFDFSHQTAFHEAGHAASIYLGNKQKNLPPVFFQIQINKNFDSDNQHYAKVIDGRLIQNLPTAGLEYKQLNKEQQLKHQAAYEADVINLLVGPLAEAKYVSIRDGEAFNFNLLNTHSLNYYGGSSDVESAYAYLEHFISSEAKREEKMLELFSKAYLFIEKTGNWKCILNFAHHILDSDKDIISCEEAVEVFKECLKN